MPTAEETMQAILDQGGNLNDVQEALKAAEAAPPTSPQSPEVAPTATDGDWKATIPAEYHDAIEGIRRSWESGATPKFQKATEWDAFANSMKTNPKGTLLYLREKYGVQMDEPQRPPAQPRRDEARDDFVAQKDALRKRFLEARNSEEAWPIMDELSELQGRRIAQASVQPVQAAVVSQMEEAQIKELENDPNVRQLGIDVRALYPQIKAHQQTIAATPYVKVREAFHAVVGDRLVADLAAERAKGARPAVTREEKTKGTVAGPAVGAPQGTTFSFDKTTPAEREKLLLAAGFSRE